MRDLRDLLDDAAGDPPDLPDIEMIRRRARPSLVRRRMAVVAGVVALGLAGVVGVDAGLGLIGNRQDVVVQPPPPPPAPPAPDAAPIRQGQLEPGSYRGEVGRYAFVLRTRSDEWSVLVTRPGWLALTYRQYTLHVQVWGGVLSPEADRVGSLQPVPADLAPWIATNGRLSTGAARGVEVGGIAATELDARVIRPLENPPGECPTPQCVVLGRVAGTDELVDLDAGHRATFLVVGPPGQQVVVFYRAPEAEFPVLDQAVQALLADLRLTPTG